MGHVSGLDVIHDVQIVLISVKYVVDYLSFLFCDVSNGPYANEYPHSNTIINCQSLHRCQFTLREEKRFIMSVLRSSISRMPRKNAFSPTRPLSRYEAKRNYINTPYTTHTSHADSSGLPM